MENYYYLNGKFKIENKEQIDRISQEEGVYEVIRVVDKSPLFAKEHIKRLYDSAELLSINVEMQDKDMYYIICKLTELNKVVDQNIKLIFTKSDIIFYFIDSFYPPAEMANRGVKTVFYEVIRDNPNAKVHNAKLRAEINQYLMSNEAYEAILIDEKNVMLEGSRSNIFFIKDNSIYTAPSNQVLMGITREKVLEICKKSSIEVIEKNLTTTNINSIQAAFMTSTSNNILPIRQIENHMLCVNNKIISNLTAEFAKKVHKDLIQMKNVCQDLLIQVDRSSNE